MNYLTLVDLLQDRAQQAPDKQAFTFLGDGENITGTLTFAQLDQQARAIATQLQTLTQPGDRALVVYPFTAGLEFIAAFYGCLYAGVVAVTDNPPRNKEGLQQLCDRMVSTQATLILSTQSLIEQVEQQVPKVPGLDNALSAVPRLATDTIRPELATHWVEPSINPDALAFMQHTSGSTGTPKGVMISHRNFLHNSEAIYQSFEHHTGSHGVMWLPLFHDMGLVGGVIQPVYGNCSVTLMSPISLIQQPVKWLQAISKYRANTSGGSNFAYDLLCQKVTAEQRQSLDLNCWEVAFSGAEPIRSATLDRFVELFSPCGFRREAFYPCYGLAETTLFVTGGNKTTPPIVEYLEQKALSENQAVSVPATYSSARPVVGCGHTWLGDKIVIMDPDLKMPCAEQHIGEVWVKGDGVAQGYWQQPDENEYIFNAYLANQEGPFLRTGDLGYLHGGELFITGRLKDMMILWGRNHYPHQIEQTVYDAHPALRRDHGAAFTIDIEGEEKLVIVQEIERTSLRSLNPPDVIQAIWRAVADQHIAAIYGIALLKPASIPKTSSGKVQRHQCRHQFLEKRLQTVAEWQVPPDQYRTITDLMSQQETL